MIKLDKLERDKQVIPELQTECMYCNTSNINVL